MDEKKTEDKKKDVSAEEFVELDPRTPENIKAMVKLAIAKLGPQFSKEEKLNQAKAMMEMLQKGVTMRKAMGISDEEFEAMYKYCYSLFAKAQFKEARELFNYMVILQPTQPNLAICLGVCHHKLGDYRYAASSYCMAYSMNPEDPLPLFYCYDCFMKLNEPGSAMASLVGAIDTADDREEFKAIKERASLMLEALKKTNPEVFVPLVTAEQLEKRAIEIAKQGEK